MWIAFLIVTIFVLIPKKCLRLALECVVTHYFKKEIIAILITNIVPLIYPKDKSILTVKGTLMILPMVVVHI